MARIPLIHKSGAERGERGEAVAHLRQLARSLRNSPTDEELDAAATLLERAAVAGRTGAAEALYLTVSHRPPETARNYEIWMKAESYIANGMHAKDAYKLIAKQRSLSESRIRAIHTSWRKGIRRAAEDVD